MKFEIRKVPNLKLKTQNSKLKSMGIDIKLPIGLMFSILGLLLLIFGLATGGNQAMYEKSLHVNINLWIGLTMLVFGGFMLLLSFRKKKGGK
ncbi:MAG: hypothetical protein Q8L68_06760 [Methylococcales bacterium]|nr:hypothetical protein [Methylococcales bacterium]